jgi:hypothetical protein
MGWRRRLVSCIASVKYDSWHPEYAVAAYAQFFKKRWGCSTASAFSTSSAAFNRLYNVNAMLEQDRERG